MYFQNSPNIYDNRAKLLNTTDNLPKLVLYLPKLHYYHYSNHLTYGISQSSLPS